jgi:tetratricopeptide (TPR) repeat protein
MTRYWSILLLLVAVVAGIGIGVAVRPQLSGSHADAQVATTSQLAALEDSSAGGKASPSTNALVRRYAAEARNSPNDPQALAQLSLAYMQKERETGDVQYYTLTDRAAQSALKLDGTNATAITTEAWVAMGQHDFVRAAEIATMDLKRDPTDPEMLANLGDAEANLGNYTAMEHAYQKMVNAKPSLASYNRAAYGRWILGDVRGAVRFMLMAIRAGSTQPENVAWCQSELGDYLFNTGAVIPAQQQYESALKTFPHYARALAGLAAVDAALHRPKAAEALYRQAIAAVPLPQYLTALGDLQASMGDMSAANRQYATIHFIEHLFTINHVRYGVEEAQFDADHNQSLGSALTIAQREAQTRHDYLAEDTLAWALYRNGRYADAWKAEQQALKVGVHLAPLYYHAGMIQAKLGDVTEAQSYLQNALMTNPNFSPLYVPVARAELLRLNAAVAQGAVAKP